MGRQRRLLMIPSGQHYSSCYWMGTDLARNDRGSYALIQALLLVQPSALTPPHQYRRGSWWHNIAFLFSGSPSGGEKEYAYNARIRALRILGSQMDSVKHNLALNKAFVILVRLLEFPCLPLSSCWDLTHPSSPIQGEAVLGVQVQQNAVFWACGTLGLPSPLDHEHLEAGLVSHGSAHWGQRGSQRMFAG